MDLTTVKQLYVGGKDVFTLYVNNGLAWKKIHGFKMTAKEANSTIQLTVVGNPDAITLVKSLDGGVTWSAYNVGDTITLTNVNDYVLLEAGANGNSSIGTNASNYYKFVITGKVNADFNSLNYLLNQSGQVSGSLPQYCYPYLFNGCSSLEGEADLSWFTDGGQMAFRNLLAGTGVSSIDLSGLVSSNNSSILKEICNGCANLTSINLGNFTTSGGYQQLQIAFQNCTSLTSVSIPNLTTVSGDAALSYIFKGCTSLKNVNLKKLSTVSGTNPLTEGFRNCTSLEVLDFSEATSIPAISSNTFTNTNSTFKVIVPDALYNDWIAATNWSSISSQIVKASDNQ